MDTFIAVLMFSSMIFSQRCCAFTCANNLPLSFQLNLASNSLKLQSNLFVDIVEKTVATNSLEFREAVNILSDLKLHPRAVMFGVPGAFTPTCSLKHLPGFIESAKLIHGKGVDAIYCLSVNDRFVMRAWGEATPGFLESDIKMIADGNGDLTVALGLAMDRTDKRMGALRSKRFAAIVEFGNITTLLTDEAGLDKTSAENILSLL